jgi:hypothetical protein
LAWLSSAFPGASHPQTAGIKLPVSDGTSIAYYFRKETSTNQQKYLTF